MTKPCRIIPNLAFFKLMQFLIIKFVYSVLTSASMILKAIAKKINRPYQTETNKMHPIKSWPKLIFGTVIKPIEFSNISTNQPNLS